MSQVIFWGRLGGLARVSVWYCVNCVYWVSSWISSFSIVSNDVGYCRTGFYYRLEYVRLQHGVGSFENTSSVALLRRCSLAHGHSSC